MSGSSEKAGRHLYYVSSYSERMSSNAMFRPACITKIGVASDRHIYNDSETFDTPGGNFYVDVYADLASAWEACKRRATLMTIVLDDNMSDDDRHYITNDINANPDMMEYHYSGRGTSLYTIKAAYIRHHEMKAMCNANRLPVNFRLAGSTALSEKYSERYAKNDRDGNMRDSVFDKQAEYQKSMGLRFSSDFINEVTDVSITDQMADQRMDAYFKAIADIYNMDFVSISDIDMGELKESPEGALFTEVTYNGQTYVVTIDESRRESYQRQAADSVLRQVREAAAQALSADSATAEHSNEAAAETVTEVDVPAEMDAPNDDVSAQQSESQVDSADPPAQQTAVRETIDIDMSSLDNSQDADFDL